MSIKKDLLSLKKIFIYYITATAAINFLVINFLSPFNIDNISFGLILITLANLIIASFFNKPDLAATIFLLISPLWALKLINFNDSSDTPGIIFLYSFLPFLIFYFKGAKKGLIWSLYIGVFIVSFIIFIFINYSNFLNPVIIFQIILAFFNIMLLSYFYQYSNEKSLLKLQYKTYYDSLTGLGKRSKLLEEIEASQNPNLCIVEIDDFKKINSIYGYSFGDELLLKFSETLNTAAKSFNMQSYRLYSGVFAIFTNKKLTPQQIIDSISKIHTIVEETHFSIKKIKIDLDATFAICNQKENILEKTLLALHKAKKDKMHFIFFTPDIETDSDFKKNIETMAKIRSALLNKRVITHFQPIFDNNKKVIKKYEALVRILDNQNNIIPPYQFLPVAKSSKYYHNITCEVVRQVIEKAKKINNADFSINISIEDIFNLSTQEYIRNILSNNESVANRIVFEFLEDEGIDNYDIIIEFIGMVKSFGCKTAIDDFGSGYSNFAHILKLNIDYIKIDGSIIKNISSDNNSVLIAESIIYICKKMNIKTVAEFVSSAQIMEKVIALGIDYSQGFHIGKPDFLEA